jgi:hypothetical protein
MSNRFSNYNDQELAEIHIFPHGLTPEEKDNLMKKCVFS